MRSPTNIERDEGRRRREGDEARRNLAVARSIWPTGKPARPMSAAEAAACCAKVEDARARGYSEKYIATFLDVSLPVHDHARRTRGIAEGRRLAAQRKRFAAWLRTHHAYGTAAAAATVSWSPATFVMKCDWYHLRCIADAAGFAWSALSLSPLKKMRLALLASPEWAALPWQREGGR